MRDIENRPLEPDNCVLKLHYEYRDTEYVSKYHPYYPLNALIYLYRLDICCGGEWMKMKVGNVHYTDA